MALKLLRQELESVERAGLQQGMVLKFLTNAIKLSYNFSMIKLDQYLVSFVIMNLNNTQSVLTS
jgi:hypothetical protein